MNYESALDRLHTFKCLFNTVSPQGERGRLAKLTLNWPACWNVVQEMKPLDGGLVGRDSRVQCAACGCRARDYPDCPRAPGVAPGSDWGNVLDLGLGLGLPHARRTPNPVLELWPPRPVAREGGSERVRRGKESLGERENASSPCRPGRCEVKILGTMTQFRARASGCEGLRALSTVLPSWEVPDATVEPASSFCGRAAGGPEPGP